MAGVWQRDGLRVVELGSGISAAYAARLLADFGADVIKVEPPGSGDETRHAGPFPGDVPNPETSGLFLYLNINKRSVALDVTAPSDAARLAALLADADVLVENLGPGRLDALPLPAGALHPRLVVCSISPFGQDGPRAYEPSSEIGVYAAGGMMYITGDGSREPVKHGLNQAAHLAGVNAAAATLAAALLARRTGSGQRIDISEQETVAQTIFPALNIYSHTGGVMRRAPSGITSLVNSSPMPVRDGYIMPSYAGFGEWEAFAAFLGVPELAEERFLTPQGRLRHAAEIDRLVEPRFRAMSKDELFHSGQEWRFTFTSVQTAADLANCPHLTARNFFIEQQHPVAGIVRMPGMVPFGSEASRATVRPAPLLGEHTGELGAGPHPLTPSPNTGRGGRGVETDLDERGLPLPGRERAGVRVADRYLPITVEQSPPDTSSPRPVLGEGSGVRASSPLPLSGIRILELGMVFVLPYALTPLAALGADVIKVEAGARPDQTRWGPAPDNRPRADGYNHGANFQMLNRNKRGITIDLAQPAGRELFLRLVAVSDVVAENFTPRVLRNLGLEYEQLRAVNERIILLSSSGFGQTGPWANYRAYGPNTEAVDGLMHVTGYPDGPPVRGGAGGLGVAFTDAAGAFFGSYAILAALEQRERTGTGQWLDLSHYEAGVATIPEAVLDFTMNGRVTGRIANRHPQRAPQGVYRCAGEAPGWLDQSPPETDDRWVAISVSTDAQFAALADAMNRPELASDPRYSTLEARRQHHDELDALIDAWTRTRATWILLYELRTRGVQATAVAMPDDVWLDSQLWHRGFFQMVPPAASAPEIGPRPHLRPAWKMSVTPAETRRRAPEFGEHTDEVLAECLGLSADEIAALEAAEVIARTPNPGILARPGPMDLEVLLQSGRLQKVDPDYQRNVEWFQWRRDGHAGELTHSHTSEEG